MSITKSGQKPPRDTLYEAILLLKDVDECKRLFQDLCTVAEMRAMEQRFEVALMLDQGLIYNDIMKQTGASSATISRVNRSLQYGVGGYEGILPRFKEMREAQAEAGSQAQENGEL